MSKNAIFAAAVLSVAFATVQEARAERRLNSLHSDVAVRNRRLLVKNRFEVTPLFESTLNPEFQHIVGGGLKLEYHLSDMWSVGAVGVASTQFNTKLTDRILDTLPGTPMDGSLEPSVDQFKSRLNTMPVHGAAYISLTPWYGKLAAFSAAYVAFDFYFQGGVSYAQLKSDCPPSVCNDPSPGKTRPGMGDETIPPDNNPNNDDPLNSGTRIGLYLGGGIHV